MRGHLIGEAKVEYRHQMDVGHAQGFDVVKTGGIAAAGFPPSLRQAQKLALVSDVAGAVHGQVPQVQLIEHRVRDALPGERVVVILPALRVGAFQIQHHGPLSIHTHGPGVGVAGLPGHTVHGDQIGIVQPLQISHPLGNPCALRVRVHLLPGQRLPAPALQVQQQAHFLSGGRPDPEHGFAFRPESA